MQSLEKSGKLQIVPLLVNTSNAWAEVLLPLLDELRLGTLGKVSLFVDDLDMVDLIAPCASESRKFFASLFELTETKMVFNCSFMYCINLN